MPMTDDTLMIEPPRSSILGKAALVVRKVPVKMKAQIDILEPAARGVQSAQHALISRAPGQPSTPS